MRRPSLMACFGAAALVALVHLPAGAQETFEFSGAGGTLTWESADNWTGGSGDFSQWPGQAPDTGRDSALVTGDWDADGLTLQINTPLLRLDTLRMGDVAGASATVITGGPDASLSVSSVEPQGAVFASNALDVDLQLEGDLDFENANTGITLNGRLINRAPSDGQFRDVVNDTTRELTINGDVMLSDRAGDAGHVRFFNGGGDGSTTINGVISDGPAAGGYVTYEQGRFDLTGENAYTGRTTLGENGVNVGATLVIHTDSPFGAGRVVVAGGNALKTVRAAFGGGPRTLSNDWQIAREVEFAGNEPITLNGAVYQSNERALTNNIAPLAGALTINGPVYASDSADVRQWTFDGGGTTIVTSVIDDSLGHPNVTGASLAKEGTGRVVLTHPDAAAYGGPTHVNEGTLQLGEGGAAVNLNDNVVSGDGVLEINHAGHMTFTAAFDGGLTVRHTGAGVTRLERTSDGDGAFEVSAGTLLVNSGDGVSSGAGSGDVTVSGNGALGGSGHVGGAVSVLGGGRLAPGASTGALGVGSLNLASGGTLEIELAGSTPGEGFDALNVDGGAALAGELMITLNDYSPSPTDQFTILNAASLSGAFANVAHGARLDSVDGGGSFAVAYDYKEGEVRLSDFEPSLLAGDYNEDGVVDAADYVVWRDNVGAPNGTLPNDPEPGPIGAAQYARWLANFGVSSPAITSPGAPAPEPLSALLLAIAFGGMPATLGLRRLR